MRFVTAGAPKRRGRYGVRCRNRFAACKLVLHPEKTKIVYCEDANRRGDFPNQSFDFLGFTFRARKALGRGPRAFACFLPAAGPKALTSIGRIGGGDRTVGPGQPALAGLVKRALRIRRNGQNAGCALDHNLARIGRSRPHQGDPP